MSHHLIDELAHQEAEHDRMLAAGNPGRAFYHLLRTYSIKGQMREQLQVRTDVQNCCSPYPPAKHAMDCHTVTHGQMVLAAWDDPNTTLTACGFLGPIAEDPTCETCRAHLGLS